MKKLLSGLIAIFMFSSVIYAADTNGITQSDIQTINSAVKEEYNRYPILTKYCGAYKDIGEISENDIYGDAISGNLGCGKYNLAAKRVTTDFQKKAKLKGEEIGRKLEKALAQGKIENSISAIVKYTFLGLTNFAKDNYSNTLKARQKLVEQKKLIEAKDFQSAMSIVTWKTIIIIAPYLEKEVLLMTH